MRLTVDMASTLDAGLVVVDVGDDGALIVLEDDGERIVLRRHVRASFWRVFKEYVSDRPCGCDEHSAMSCQRRRGLLCACQCHWSGAEEYPRR